MYIGAHVSSAGGLYKAFERAEKMGAECLQIFTRAPSQWKVKPFEAEVVDKFRGARQQSAVRGPVYVHDLYLTNLAATDAAIRERSTVSQIEELKRCYQLGVDGLVCHLGSHVDRRQGLEMLSEAMHRILNETPPVKILLETTAGQGNCLGCKFEDLAFLLERHGTQRLAACLDSCHVFAAGYDLQSDADRVLAEFDRIVGLQHLELLHLNDSKKPLGCRVDRHTHIGEGCIGSEAFRNLLRRLKKPVVIETPESETMHAVNIARLKELRS